MLTFAIQKVSHTLAHTHKTQDNRVLLSQRAFRVLALELISDRHLKSFSLQELIFKLLLKLSTLLNGGIVFK